MSVWSGPDSCLLTWGMHLPRVKIKTSGRLGHKSMHQRCRKLGKLEFSKIKKYVCSWKKVTIKKRQTLF